MSTKTRSPTILIGAVLVALIVGGAVGYFARAGEVSSLMNENLTMHQEMQSMSTAIPLNPASGQMPPHDVWLVIAPLQGGDFAVILMAQGLEQNSSYLIEGVTRGGQMNTVPFAGTIADSEFVPDMHGNGLYWHVLMNDPRLAYEQVVLLYLPNMEMQGEQQVATANLG
jgi:hypothetical protein